MPLRLLLLCLALPYVLVLIHLIKRGYLDGAGREQTRHAVLKPLRHQKAFWWFMGGALFVRLVMMPYAGFTYDTGTYIAWALDLARPDALANFYREGYHADYPSLYMYVLMLAGNVIRWFGVESHGLMLVIIKTPTVLADLAVAWVLLDYCRKRYTGALPWALAGLFAFNPVVLMDGAFWGQTDVMLSGLVLASILFLEEKRLVWAAVFLAAALAFKPQAAIFVIFLIPYAWRFYPRRAALAAAAASALVYLAIIMPFAYTRPWNWIFTLYTYTAKTYPYLTANADNFWMLLDFNWRERGNDFLGLGTDVWAVAVPVLAVGLVCLATMGPRAAPKGPETSEGGGKGTFLFPTFYLLAFVMFMFFPRMHERYLFPALVFMIPMLPLARRYQWVFAGLSGLLLFNMSWVFHSYMNLGQVTPYHSLASQVVSAGLLVLFGLSLFWVAADFLPAVTGWSGRIAEWGRAMGRRVKIPLPRLRREPGTPFVLRPGDYTALAIVFAASLSLLLFRIGDLSVPRNFYELEIDPVEFEIEFSSPQRVAGIRVFKGRGTANLSLTYDLDGGRRPVLEMDDDPVVLGDFYKVMEKTSKVKPRAERLYLKLWGRGATIGELGFVGENGALLTPSRIIERSGDRPLVGGGNAVSLFDEQETIALRRGYLASTYFDEIYHARTAYEYIEDLPAYETTHPQLGKILLGTGIRLFDMTPFGTRFMGAVFAALWPLLLFLGGRLVSGRRTGAYGALLLGAVSFMNFTVGRFATVDIYLVVFLLAMYLCLFCWRRAGGGPLGMAGARWVWAAGLFFGLAVAVKWNAFYAVFGVILLLCYYFARETIDNVAAGPGRPAYWSDRVPRFLGLWFGAFVVVPFAVYYLSYGEYLESLPGGAPLFTWAGMRAVAAQQLEIFNYHANLTSSHPYASAYYTWPYVAKPVWLFLDNMAAPGVRSSISLMGNPLIWWSGLVAMAVLLWRTLGRPWPVGVFLVGAYLTQFLPWILIDRVTFIYHYFPCLTFVILALAYGASRLDPARRANQVLLGAYGLAVVVLFVMFYPAISGLPVAENATTMLRWLPQWGIL